MSVEYKSDDIEQQKQFPVFTRSSVKIDKLKTINAFNDIPTDWNTKIDDNNRLTQWTPSDVEYNEFLKDIMFKKFHFASMTKYQSAESYPGRVYCFVDNNDNLCIITDTYEQNQVNELTDKYQNSDCIVEMYYHRNPKDKIYFDVADFSFQVHKKLILILRIPYSKFKTNYNNSFQKHLLQHYLRYQNVLSNNPQLMVDENNIVHQMYKTFFDLKVIFTRFPFGYSDLAPENIITQTPTYETLFRSFVPLGETAFHNNFISPFVILYELFDNPKHRTENTIEAVLPSDISETSTPIICQYLFTENNEFNFENYIKQQLEMDASDAYNLQNKFGPNTWQYEWDLYLQKGIFMANPYKYKYLSGRRQQRVDEELKTYISKWNIYTPSKINEFLEQLLEVPTLNRKGLAYWFGYYQDFKENIFNMII